MSPIGNRLLFLEQNWQRHTIHNLASLLKPPNTKTSPSHLLQCSRFINWLHWNRLQCPHRRVITEFLKPSTTWNDSAPLAWCSELPRIKFYKQFHFLQQPVLSLRVEVYSVFQFFYSAFFTVLKKGNLEVFFLPGHGWARVMQKPILSEEKKIEEFYSSKGTAVLKLMNFITLLLAEVTGRK